MGGQDALLDANGAMLQTVDHAPIGAFMGAGVHGGRYVVAAVPPAAPANVSLLYTITDSGSVSQAPLSVFGIVAAFGPDSILFVTDTTYAVAGYDGTVVKPFVTPPLVAGQRSVAAGWDGHEFLAVFSGRYALRLEADGTAIDPVPLALSQNSASQMTVATGSTAVLVAWSDFGLVGRTARDFDALALAASSPPVNLALSGEAQVDAQVALAGGTMFGVWSDPGRYEVQASVDGAPFTVESTASTNDWIGWPAIAAGNHTILILWRHNVTGTGGSERVLARRFDFSGQPLDAEPIVIDSSSGTSQYQNNNTAPAITFDGSAFFVSWGRGPKATGFGATALYTVRIDEEGQLHGRTDTPSGSDVTSDQAARVLWTGSQYAVVHVIDHVVFQGPADQNEIKTLHFDQTNTAVAEATPPAVFDYTGSAVVGVTLDTDRIAYAWVDGGGNVLAGRANVDGSLLQPARMLIERNGADAPSYADIAWDSSNYVLVWLDTIVSGNAARKLRAVRLDRNLNPIEPAPFDVFSVAGPLSAPRLMRTSNGVVIVYSRSDLDNGGAARAFVRSLEAVAPVLLPDLLVSGAVGLTPNPVTAGKAVTVTYQIKNQGSAAAGATTTHIEIRRDGTNALAAAQDFATASIAADDATRETRVIVVADTTLAGTYTVTISLDRTAALVQSSTSNDTAAAKLAVIASCKFAFAQSAVTLPADGGAGSITVIANDPTCAWTVTSRDEWLVMRSATGIGNGTVIFNAGANPSSQSRTATLSLGAATAVVRQGPFNPRRRPAH